MHTAALLPGRLSVRLAIDRRDWYDSYVIRKTRILPAILLVAAAALIAFGMFSILGGPSTVTGQVVSVEGASVTIISRLTVEDDRGRRWTFREASTFAGFTPSHLEEHRSSRQQITVEYEELSPGVLTILGLKD